LSVHLVQLIHAPDASLHGATGELRLDHTGMVQRTPVWLTFRRGEVVILGEN